MGKKSVNSENSAVPFGTEENLGESNFYGEFGLMDDYKIDNELKSNESLLEHQMEVSTNDAKRRYNVAVEHKFEVDRLYEELIKKQEIENLHQSFGQKPKKVTDEVQVINEYARRTSNEGITPFDIDPSLLEKYKTNKNS